MDYIRLGRTGLKASVMGIGAGGPSRVGKNTGKTAAESTAIIRQALDAGVNLIDTSEAYQTEDIVGQAIRGYDRTKLILSTKKRTRDQITPKDLEASLEASLKRLGTDYIDIYHLHAVTLEEYDYLFKEIVPALQAMKQAGKIRFIGLTERFGQDTDHAMFRRALHDDVWDVLMVGFNILNQSAREMIFAQTIERDIGILIMFAVRRALSRSARLREVLAELIERGEIDPNAFDLEDPLGFLVYEGGALSVPDAAYRFCRYEPGVHVVLSGTGNPDHLQANLASLNRPPLPEADVARLKAMFAGVDSTAAN